MVKGWHNLSGQLWMNFTTGKIEMRYGEGGWHRTDLGNVKTTKAFKKTVVAYGTKKGKRYRKSLAVSIMRSIRVGAIKGK